MQHCLLPSKPNSLLARCNARPASGPLNLFSRKTERKNPDPCPCGNGKKYKECCMGNA
ncbi:SEC-C metal-binding domain-containing protein [Sphaerochaeta pleomorpha]|uniref:SEC-C metal-binding domain-containing protein n=1 Tax=Sphaerochaeta pleomorpha TaxID=1131707 RepID=UPI0009DB0BB6